MIVLQSLFQSPVFGLVFWVLVFLVALVAEVSVPQLVSIWFCGGALVSFVLSLFPGIPFWVEVLVFVAVSAVLLVLSFVFFRKSFLNSKNQATNIDAIFGEEVVLLSECHRDLPGEVYYRDIIWKVIPKNENEVFSTGEAAIVVSVKGNRLIIAKKGK